MLLGTRSSGEDPQHRGTGEVAKIPQGGPQSTDEPQLAHQRQMGSTATGDDEELEATIQKSSPGNQNIGSTK